MYLGKVKLDTINKTKKIAHNLYNISKVGDLFALYGDIGTGKTTFARFFINLATNYNHVPSPTYNIYFRYDSKKAPIYHMDAWRIENDNEIFNLGILDFFKESIFLIEWADKVDAYLPKNKLNIRLEYNKNYRSLSFHGDSIWKKRLDKHLHREFLEK